MTLFDTLWNNFPTLERMQSVCTNKQKDSNKPFSDYCAIRMSECLMLSGYDLTIIKGNRCWSHPGRKHILLAEELANGLKKFEPPGLGQTESIDPGSFQKVLKGRTGVIFFKDYWQRGSENFGNRSGDHIDLWNKNSITSGSMIYRSITEFFGFVSDLNNSKEVWFWEVK